MSRAGTAYVSIQPDFSKLNKEMAGRFGQLERKYGRFNVDVKTNPAANAALKQQTKTLRQLGTAAKYAAGGAALLGGAGVVSAISTAANFEQQISRLGAVAGASGKQMKTLQSQALKAGAATKFSALDAAKAQTELAKGGLSVQQIMSGGLKSALALAAAGEMDLADAASTTVNAMKLFNLNGKDSMVVADALATAANKTTADVSDFALALSQGGSAAKLAGLSFNETVVTLEALAEAGIKGSDAGTSLKSFFINIGTPSKKSAEAMKELGVNIFDATGKLKPLPAISENLRQAFGHLTKQQFLQKAGTIAGSDAIRTLYSLYAAGPSKLEKLASATAKHGTAAAVSAKKQANLKGAIENLKGSFETLEIEVGTMALPGLTKFSKRLTGVVNDIAKISGRKDLDFGEKIHLSMQKLEKEFGPDVQRLHLDQFLGEAISKGTAKIAEAAAKAAPKAVHAFFEAWRSSDIWGKLVIGGFLLHKMGGLAAYRALGKKSGAAMGGGIAESSGTAVATQLPGRMRSAAGKFRSIGKSVLGVALMAGVADAATSTDQASFGERLQRGLSTVTAGIVPDPKPLSQRYQTAIDQALRGVKPKTEWGNFFTNFSGAKLKAEQVKVVRQFQATQQAAARIFGKGIVIKPTAHPADFAAIKGEFNRLRNGAVFSMGDLRKSTDLTFRLIERSMGTHTKAGQHALSDNFRAAMASIRRLKADGTITTAEAMKEISRLMSRNSKAGRTAVGTNFGLAVKFIRENMRDAKGVTKEGMDYIRDVFVKEAMAFGLSRSAALTNARGKQSEQQHSSSQAPHPQFARGGPIKGGKPTGDSIPALLERGEYVLNRKAVAHVGKSQLDAINYGQAPRFQTGGPVAMAKGGSVVAPQLQGPDSAMKPTIQKAYDVVTALANAKLAAMEPAAPSGGKQGPAGGPAGTTTFKGLTMAKWVAEALMWAAQKHGFNGQPTSGYRSHAHNVAQGRTYFSEHEGTQYPHGAVDFGGFTSGLGTKMAAVAATSDYKYPLLAPKGFRDDGHASGTGHQLGGLIGDAVRALMGGGLAMATGGPVNVGYTVYNDPPPGAFGALTNGYAELGTARRTDGGGTGRGWLAKALGRGGELPANFPLNVMINKHVKKLRKRDRGYGQGGNGITSDPHYALDVWQDSWKDFGIGASSKGTATIATGALTTSTPKTKKKKKTGPVATINKPGHGKGTNVGPKYGSKELDAMVAAYDRAGEHAEDLETFYQQADTTYNLDQIITQDELDQLLWRIEQPTGDGLIQTYAGQQGMGQTIVGNFRQTVAASKKIVAEQIAKVRKNLKDIADWKKELAKVTKQRNADEAEIRAIDRLRHPTASDVRKRANLVREVHSLDARAHKLRVAIDHAQDSNESLYGVRTPESPARDGSGARATSKIGIRVKQIDNITQAGTTIGDNLRPEGIPSQIFNWQNTAAQLRHDGATKPDDPDNADPSGTSDNQAALVSDLQEKLRQANLRTAVSETELRVLGQAGNIPPFGGSFAAGGFIPGPIGAPRTIIAHGGEFVNPVGGNAGQIQIIVRDGAVDPKYIEVIADGVVQRQTRSQARSAGRRLPGRAGAL